MNKTKWQNAARYTLAYVLWLLTLFMCIGAIIEIQAAAIATWVAIQGNRYALGLINQVSVILGGLATIIYAFALEEDYRDAVTLQRANNFEKLPVDKFANRLANLGIDILLRRFAISFAIPLGIYLACIAIVQIAVRMMATAR